jgi:hypothetical protein
VIDDCSRLGSGVIKGPYPTKMKAKAWNGTGQQATLEIVEKIVPASKRIDPWDLFPDRDCGQDIHSGDYVFERDRMSASKLKDLRGGEGYIDGQIDLVLQEGPTKHTAAGVFKPKEDTELFEVWHYHGIVTKDEIEAAGCECDDDAPTIHASLILVNDTIIRLSMNPLGGGAFPYDVIPWKKRPGMPWGTGVPRMIRTPQRMVVAASRNLMNNAGLAGGPQIVVRKNGIQPKDGSWELKPLKIWLADDDTQDVSKAFQAVVFPMLIAELERIIQMGLKFAEDVTGLPMLLQGQQGKAPDTVGGMTMLNNNATAVLRRIAKLFDSKITEPHIGRYYTYLLEYGEDDGEKGDFFIDARGSSALVERDIQTQEMIQVLQLSASMPALGWDPKKAGKEYLKSRRFDPAAFEYTEEEMKAKAQQPPPEPPVITAAKIRSASAEKIAGLNADVKVQVDKSDTDRDTIYVQAETQRTQAEHEGRMAELAVRRELAMLDYANKNQLKLNDVKSQLAQTAMKLRATKELAALNATAANLPKPPVEPAGRAPAGRSFTQ